MDTKVKKRYGKSIVCPWCGKMINVEAGDEIIKPAVSAEKIPYVKIEKDTQASLDKDYKKVRRKGMKDL